MSQGVAVLIRKAGGLRRFSEAFQCAAQLVHVALPPVNPGEQTQAGYMFRIACQQFIYKFEQIILFAPGEHLLDDVTEDSGGFVVLAQLQIQSRDFDIGSIV